MATAEEYRKPIPGISKDTAPYWKALQEHKLVLPRCNHCGKVNYPPRPFCPDCLSFDVRWQLMSGRGTVYTFSVVYQNKSPGFAREVPYAVGYVTLDEGPQVLTNIVQCDPEQVHIGQRVEIVYDDVLPDLTLAKFRPASG
jgi:uncharacterized OB-fold protein